MHVTIPSAVLCAAVSLQASGGTTSPSMKTEHIRGTIQSVDREALAVATSAGSVRVRLSPSTPVTRVVRSDRAQITDGSFLGITSVTDPDGAQRAVEVHVFPEAMRGAGEGSYGWGLAGGARGRTLTTGMAG